MTVNYVYGADGERAVKYSRLGETLYFDSMWVVCPDRREQMSKNVYVGEVRVATRVNSLTGPTVDYAEQNTYYYHGDHVGSAQLITDYRGEMYERVEYTPYGEVWIESKYSGNLYSTPYRFTGKELDEETGLYYYGARYLDPKTSLWLSSDPALGEYIPAAPVNDDARKHNQNLPGQGGVFNTVNLHVYHYAWNNPVKYIDPTGLSPYDQYKSFFTENETKLLSDRGISPLGIALDAKHALDKAYEIGKQQGWDKREGWQGRIDAFRHAYWSAELAMKLGVENAEFITSLHEAEHPNSEMEQLMDLINNKFGLDLIRSIEDIGISENQIIEAIINEIETGTDVVYFTDYLQGANATQLENGVGDSFTKQDCEDKLNE